MMEAERLAVLVKSHAAALVLYARQWSAAPEDIVQEAFLKLMRQPQEPANPTAWLYRVVRNAAISAARAECRRKRHEAGVARRAPWFIDSFEGELDARAAATALQGLPLELREVLVAHLWGGLTFEQISELCGCSSSTAHRWYLEGLQRLRERLHIPCPTRPTNRN